MAITGIRLGRLGGPEVRNAPRVAARTALTLTLAVGLATGLPSASAVDEDEVPTQAEVDAAAQHAEDVADSVGAIKAQLAMADQQLYDVSLQAEQAVEAWNGARYELGLAREAARQAEHRSVRAEAELVRQRKHVAAVTVSTFQSGNDLARVGTLAAGGSPEQILAELSAYTSTSSALQATYDQYDAARSVATVLQKQADAAVNEQHQAELHAEEAKQAAAVAVSQAQTAVSDITASKDRLVAALAEAQGISVSLAQQRQQALEEAAQERAEAQAAAEARAQARADARAEAQQAAMAAKERREAAAEARAADEAAEAAEAETGSEAADEAADPVPDTTAARAGDRAAARAADRAAERAADRAAERAADRAAERAADRTAGKSREARKDARQDARKDARRDARQEARQEARQDARQQARQDARQGARQDARQEARQDARQEARQEARQDARQEARQDARQQARQDERRADRREERRNAPAPNPGGSGGASRAIAFARAQLGEPYLWGGAGPNSWDCSGLTAGAWGAAGKYLPHYSVAQYYATTPVSISSIRPGDLLFWGSTDNPDSIHHVALYIGDGMMIHAARTGQPVQVASMYYWIPPNFATRV